MTNTIALGLAVGLAAGAAGAGVATLLQDKPVAQETVTSLAPGDSADLADEVEALRAANSALQERLARLESSSLVGSRTVVPEGGAPQEFDADALKAELEEYLASLRNPAVGPPKHFEQWVEASMESIEAREDAAREAERLAREDERFEERLTEMTTELGLDNIQATQMRKTLGDMRVAQSDLRTQARELEDRRESWTFMREGMTALNEASNATLQGFLSPAQFESYAEKYQDNGFGGRGGGGFGGGRGGGGGGRGGF